MSKDNINIAVVVSGIDEEYQNRIIKGIKTFAIEKKINISCFISFGGILANKKHDMGEFNIFNLINYERFDGIILMTNTIPSQSAVEEILFKVRRSKIPAVSIDYDLKDSSYYIGIDNFSSMEKMVRHFIEHHKLKTINYISGPVNNIDSIERLSAYKYVLSEYNIPICDERIYHGFFRGQDGRRAVERFIQLSKENPEEFPMPEAIICANDAMALSAVIELEKQGYKVPEDIKVSGFDNIFTASNYSPEISSVARPLFEAGYLACEKIYNHINNIPQERVDILDTKLIFTESCGCFNEGSCSISEFKKSNYSAIELYKIGIPLINRMSASLTESESFSDNVEYLKNFIAEINCEEFYLCLCEDWKRQSNINYNTYFQQEYSLSDFSRTVSVPIAYYEKKFRNYESFDTSLMHPNIFTRQNNKGNIFFFSPVHYQDRCLGYTVMCNSDFPIDSPIYHTWIMNISNSIENIRKIICLEAAVTELEKLYVIDPLGNIYNRNGFNKYTKEIYNDCIINRRKIMIMFIDMDGLKYINDHYGHKEGDNAIIQICNVLKNICFNGEICARFGGDEFIIFAADYNEKQAEELAINFTRELEEYNSFSNKPYKIEASYGFSFAYPDSNMSIFKMIGIADKKMYDNKKKKTQSKYIRHDP